MLGGNYALPVLLGPPGSEIDTRGFKTPDKGDAQQLWNLAPLMPPGRNYSRINEGRPELIDHILVSDVLVRKVGVTSVGAILAEPPSWCEWHARCCSLSSVALLYA